MTVLVRFTHRSRSRAGFSSGGVMRLVATTGLLAVAMLGSVPASAATNVALASAGGEATASTNTSTEALVNDGNTASQGWVVPAGAATIKVDWGAGKAVNQVVAIFANAN